MGVNGANGLNNVDIVKLALQKKGVKTQSAQIPTWMTPQGSVWNAPKAQAENKTQTGTPATTNTENKQDNIAVLNDKQKAESSKSYDDIDKLKTAKSTQSAIDDLKTDMETMNFAEKIVYKKKLDKLEEKHKEQVKEDHEFAMKNLKSIGRGDGALEKDGSTEGSQDKTKADVSNLSASEGKAMAKDAENQQASVKEGTQQTKENTKKVNDFSKDAQKQSKSIAKDQKSLDKEIKSHTKTVQQNQTKISKMIESNEAIQEKNDALNAELESLTAGDNTGVGVTSAFSLSLAGQREQDQQMGLGGANAQNGNESRIAELQSQIQANSTAMTKSGQQIGKLQTSTNKTIKTMHHVTTKYNMGMQKAQKNLQNNEKTTDKIIKVADKIDQISSTVATAGMAVNYAGKGLVLLGQATSWCFGAGAALIAAGTVMQKVGTVTEIVGNYGVAAANITKTGCYAAQGNLVGALMSAGSAIMSGAQAVKGTKDIGKTFGEINKQATEATQKLAANVTAKETVKEMTKEQLGGLTKKEAKSVARDAAMSELQDSSAKEIREAFKAGTDGALNNAASNTAKNALTEVSKESIKEGIKNGTIKVAGSSSDLVKAAAKEIVQEKGSDVAKKGLKETAKELLTFDNAMKVGNTLQTAAAKFQQKTQGAGQKNNNGYAPHMYTNPDQFYAMANKTNKRKAAVANMQFGYGRMTA